MKDNTNNTIDKCEIEFDINSKEECDDVLHDIAQRHGMNHLLDQLSYNPEFINTVNRWYSEMEMDRMEEEYERTRRL